MKNFQSKSFLGIRMLTPDPWIVYVQVFKFINVHCYNPWRYRTWNLTTKFCCYMPNNKLKEKTKLDGTVLGISRKIIRRFAKTKYIFLSVFKIICPFFIFYFFLYSATQGFLCHVFIWGWWHLLTICNAYMYNSQPQQQHLVFNIWHYLNKYFEFWCLMKWVIWCIH